MRYHKISIVAKETTETTEAMWPIYLFEIYQTK